MLKGNGQHVAVVQHVVELHDELAAERTAQRVEALGLVVDDEQACARPVQPGEAAVVRPAVK